MNGKEWLYYLVNPANGSTWRKENGIITAGADYKPLVYTPDGWQDITIAWERNMSRHGANRNFTLPLGFYLDSADIVRWLRYNRNFEQVVNLLIQQEKLFIDANNFYFWYDLFYKGELDFTTFEEDVDNNKCTINIMEGGLSKKLAANRNTPYEVTLDKVLRHDGIELFYNKVFSTQAEVYSNFVQAPANLTETHNWLITFFKIGEEGTNVNLFTQDIFTTPIPDSYDLTTQDGAFMEAIGGPVDITAAHIKLRFEIRKSPTGTGGTARLRLVRSDGTALAVFADVTFGSGGYVQIFDIDTTIAFHLDAGQKAFMLLETELHTSALQIDVPVLLTINILQTDASFAFKARYRTTYIKVKNLYDIYKDLAKQITGNADDAESTLLAGLTAPYIVATSGDALRGITDAIMKPKFDDLCSAVNVLYMTGDGVVDNKIILERRQEFYKTTNPFALGDCKSLHIKPFTEGLFNTIRVGYPEVDIEGVNGRFAFNNPMVFNIPSITRIIKEHTLISPWKADPFEQEILRINLDGKTTTDGQQDNDIYMFAVEKIIEHYDASKTTPQVYTPGNLVNFNTQTVHPLIIANNALDTFKYAGPAAITVTITARVAALCSSGIFQMLIFKNADTIADVNNALGNGTNQIITVTVTLQPNDEIKLFVQNLPISTGSITVNSAKIEIEFSDGLYKLYRPAFTNIEGVADAHKQSIYNIIPFTPKRILQAHEPWLRGMLDGFENEKIKFVSAQRNKELKTELAGVIVDEDADINIGNMAAPMVKPVEFDLQPQYPGETLIEQMNANPNKIFTFRHPNGNEYAGFNLKIGAAPNTEKDQAFILLSSPDNDLKTLGNV